MPVISRSNIHLDILMGRDESIDVQDIFEGNYCGYWFLNLSNTRKCNLGGADHRIPLDIHADMEKKLRM